MKIGPEGPSPIIRVHPCHPWFTAASPGPATSCPAPGLEPPSAPGPDPPAPGTPAAGPRSPCSAGTARRPRACATRATRATRRPALGYGSARQCKRSGPSAWHTARGLDRLRWESAPAHLTPVHLTPTTKLRPAEKNRPHLEENRRRGRHRRRLQPRVHCAPTYGRKNRVGRRCCCPLARRAPGCCCWKIAWAAL